jgi:hypothetical protein
MAQRQQLVLAMVYLEWLQKKVIIAYLLLLIVFQDMGIGKTVAGTLVLEVLVIFRI